MAAIRGGYKFRLGEDWRDDEEGLTLGLGIHLTLGKRLLALDYAYADFGHLQQAHRVSLGLQFLGHDKTMCLQDKRINYAQNFYGEHHKRRIGLLHNAWK